MDEYLDPFSKIALTLTASQLAKGLIVKKEGIGEDLAFNFFAWRDNKPFLCAQLESRFMKEDHQSRFGRCYELMRVLRFELGIESLTFVAEGYVAKTPQTKELSLAFIEPNSNVTECLTVIHCDGNDTLNKPDVYLFSVPYKYALGKGVNWGGLMEFSQNAVNTIKRYAYPSMLYAAFNREVTEESMSAPLDGQVIEKMTKVGFLIEEFQ